jgi:RNA polymerase sigma factor (sigma-70 family)
MAQADDQFASLMQRIREGSQEAAQELFETYGPHIFRVVRRQLNRKLRSKYDSADFAQAVWASFFAVHPARKSFNSPEALISYLAEIARNKVIDVTRQRFQTIKYNVGREISLDQSESFEEQQLTSREPTPSQVVRARERREQIVATLSETQQRIIALLLEGYTHREIAAELDLNERTIRRLLRKVTPPSWSNDGSVGHSLPSLSYDTAEQ